MATCAVDLSSAFGFEFDANPEPACPIDVRGPSVFDMTHSHFIAKGIMTRPVDPNPVRPQVVCSRLDDPNNTNNDWHRTQMVPYVVPAAEPQSAIPSTINDTSFFSNFLKDMHGHSYMDTGEEARVERRGQFRTVPTPDATDPVVPLQMEHSSKHPFSAVRYRGEEGLLNEERIRDTDKADTDRHTGDGLRASTSNVELAPRAFPSLQEKQCVVAPVVTGADAWPTA